MVIIQCFNKVILWWSMDKLNLMVIHLDVFHVIIWNNWFGDAKVIMMPHLGGISDGWKAILFFVSSDKSNPKKDAKQGMMLLCRWRRHSEGSDNISGHSYWDQAELEMEVSDLVVDILEEFIDVMPSKLCKTLPPKRVVDHKSSWSGTKPHAKAHHWMAP